MFVVHIAFDKNFVVCCIQTCILNFVQVEIVMGLEEEFGISVEEESAQSIATVQDAADMIDKLLESKA